MRQRLAWAAALLALLAATLAALGTGRYPVGLADLPALLTGTAEGPAAAVFWNIRLPRVLAALLLGASLAGAGSAFQAMFRNPLASPDLLGVTAGASLGAVAAIWLGLPVVLIQGLAFGGGLAAVAAVLLVARAARAESDPILAMILAGVALGALVGAGIGLMKVLADPYNQLPAITFWLLGSLSGATSDDLLAAAIPALLGLVALLALRWRLNLLSLPDDEARALGIRPARLRFLAVAAATLSTAAVTALAGAVGWVGLVIPHVARLLGGAEMGRALPLSVLLGAAFVLAVDTASRSLGRVETPLGILTATLGTPLFLWLLIRRGRR